MAIPSPLRYSSLSHLTLTPSSRHLLKLNHHPRDSVIPPISCQLGQTSSEEDDDRRRNWLGLLKLSVTATIISTSLPTQTALAAKVASSSKKGASASTKKKQQEALTPDEYNSWAGDLPIVKDRLACTDLFDLKLEGKLKHVIKPPHAYLGRRAEVVLAVMDDSRVLRTVLPSRDGNPKFWEKWDELGVDSICVNAYTPPLRKLEPPSPYLGFLSAIPRWMISILNSKIERDKISQQQKMAKQEKRMKKRMEVEKIKQERVLLERSYQKQKKMEQDRIWLEKKQRARLMTRYRLARFYNSMGNIWRNSSRQQTQNLEFVGALFFFVVFYRVVVLNYKNQRKDHDDRMKIEEAEAEERRKMKQMERELAGLSADESDDEDRKGDEEDNASVKMLKNFMKSGARVRRTGIKKLPQFLDKDPDVKFADVAGLGRLRVELEEIVKFFKEGESYRKKGIKIPGGVLLCGPPGVGKTLLAKAVAGEAGVNFLSISASQFVEIYVGVGASRVRALYEEANDLAPAVVFIDELDAVGRERGKVSGSGAQERDATLNQLLVCLDGFEGRGDVITIASTNRPDILDPALVRPGRFDRKIYITIPSKAGRLEILQVYARKKPLAEDVDLEEVAKNTSGMSGAELANIFEVAALNMIHEERTEMTTDDLIQAVRIEKGGTKLPVKFELSPELCRRAALHQAGEAVVAVNFADYKNIECISIAPKVDAPLGYIRIKMNPEKFHQSMLRRQDVLDHITIQLASRAAEEMYYGKDQLSTIWAESADEARVAARTFVLSCLSENYHGVFFSWMKEKIDEIDVEALEILHACYDRVKEIVQRNRKLLDVVVEELVEKKTLTKQEFANLVELYGVLDPPRPSLGEIVSQSWVRFRQQNMNKNMIVDGSTTTPPV